MRASVRRPLLAAASFALSALALTACESGEGTREEGAASQGAASRPAEAAARPSPSTGQGGQGGQGGQAGKPDRPAGSAASAEKGTGGTSAGQAGKGGTGGTGGQGGAGHGSSSADSDPYAPANRVPCTADNTEIIATPVSRPLNHMLLTITNTGSKMCDLKGYPIVKFDDAQSVPPVMEGTKPQAVTSLAPGGKGYAGVILSAGDGSGGEGRTAQSLRIGFEGGGGMAEAALQAKGVHIDDSLRVTYWVSSSTDALN
ncbi:DUF4232 domain-containing protein [Streptomyces albireticuli]|uniref:DUF4232 domain-containing protein n=1 Tax=Streptomyces albireticuli TaxID=1940 RepID=A0A2A2DC50_9ACTN|nr:DUF4232 domain-containing protein [Streptomyces albireticuli]MCD9143905.1 DUF4232 domain-containing protein [Streptomyces albireticuli]MCD9161664.1 DUF4232 domain-containing protein [Streptomyces albireticuli]MCD9192022.1 DUF4232 domain-containing protein [Streptomyces albireticuli]PAU49017.1 hypothetical protein CK936_10095 [Streptomyces albireticuli]